MKRQHHVERACAQREASVKVPDVLTECTLVPDGQEQVDIRKYIVREWFWRKFKSVAKFYILYSVNHSLIGLDHSSLTLQIAV